MNIVTSSSKIQGVMGYQRTPPVIEYNFRKILKAYSPRCPKNTSPEVFHINPLSSNPQIVKHTQTIYQMLLVNCLSVFDHFVVLPLKGLSFLHLISNGLNGIKF